MAFASWYSERLSVRRSLGDPETKREGPPIPDALEGTEQRGGGDHTATPARVVGSGRQSRRAEWRRVGGGCDSLCRMVGWRGRGEKRGSRDPWENGSRRADSPRSNASDSFSQPVCAATSSSSLPPIGPTSDPALTFTSARARAFSLSLSFSLPSLVHPHRLSSPGLARRDHPPYSALFRPHPRTRVPRAATFVRHIYCTWIHGRPNGNVLSDAADSYGSFFFTFPREIFAPLTLRCGACFFLHRSFFFSLILPRATCANINGA